MGRSRSRSRAFGGRQSGEAVRAESSVGTLELLPDRGRPSGRMLLIDGVAHGYVDLADPAHLELDYMARIGAALDVLAPRGDAVRAVHLGGGAFTLPRFLASTRPRAEQIVVERSAAVVRLAERHLRLRQGPHLRVLTGDGAAACRKLPDASVDLLLGDAFVGTSTPSSLASPAFADEVQRLLSPGGCYLLNVVDQPPWPVVAEQADLLRERFPSVAGFGGREVMRSRHAGNFMLLASPRPLPIDALARRLAGGAHPAEVIDGPSLPSAR